MNLTMYCPNCGRKITVERDCDQGWMFCRSCQSIFFSRDSLRKNWPSLYRALKRKKIPSRRVSAG